MTSTPFFQLSRATTRRTTYVDGQSGWQARLLERFTGNFILVGPAMFVV
jgi:hypothetical protein